MDKYALVSPEGEILEFRNYAPNVDQKLLAEGKPKMLEVVDEPPEHDPQVQYLEKTYDIQKDVVTVVYTIVEKPIEDITKLVSEKIQQIKDEARRRIYEILLDHQQINAMAKGLEMLLLHGFPQGGKWPDEQQKKISWLIAKWNTIEGIRHRSDQLEAKLLVLESTKEISAFDPLAGWD